MASWYDLLRNVVIGGYRTASVVLSGFASVASDGSGVTTLTIGAPSITHTVTTTNATPVDWTIPLTLDKLTVLAYRIVGRVSGSADGGAIIREGSKVVSRDSAGFVGTLKTGGAGSDVFGEAGDTGTLYTNEPASADLSTARIEWQSTGTGGVVLRITGVAATAIDWTCECWTKEY